MLINKALIPAAGAGTRLRPLTYGVAKELVTVNHMPLIDYSVEECISAKVENICVVINKHKEGVRRYLRHRFRQTVRLTFLYQDEPTGIADAILLAEPFIEDEPFYILFPDVIYQGRDNPLIELKGLYQNFRKPCVALIDKKDKDNFTGEDYGQIECEKISHKCCKITRLHGKGVRKNNPFKATGRALWDKEIYSYLKKYRIPDEFGEYSEVPAIQKYIEENDYYGAVLIGTEYDCGSMMGLDHTEKKIRQSIAKTINNTDKPDLSVVIPVFNEEEVLPGLFNKLLPSVKKISENYEILLIDDGSRDKSFDIITSFTKEDHRIKGIRFARNFGQHAAISAGLKKSKGNIVVTMDADLQNPPEEITKLIEGLKEGYDLVWGRFEGRQHGLFRKMGSSFAKYVLKNIMGGMNTNISTFRAIDRTLVKKLDLLNENSRFIDGLFIWMGARSKVIPVKHNSRLKGKTKYNLYKLIRLWFDMVTSFSDFPLKIATVAGVGFGVLGSAAGLYYFARKILYGFDVPGFATTVIAIFLFSGIQLFCLGMLGEYLSRIFVQTKERPVFIIDKEIGFDGN